MGTYFLVWTCECMEFYEWIAKYHSIDYGAFRDQEESETELKQPKNAVIFLTNYFFYNCMIFSTVWHMGDDFHNNEFTKNFAVFCAVCKGLSITRRYVGKISILNMACRGDKHDYCCCYRSILDPHLTLSLPIWTQFLPSDS